MKEETMNKAIKIGIMPREQFQKRIIDAASGRTKLDKNDPKIWFSSMKSLNAIVGKISPPKSK